MSDIKKIPAACSGAAAKAYFPGPNLKLLSFSATAAVNRCHRVAILVGEGIDGAGVKTIYNELLAYGALPCLVGCYTGLSAITGHADLNIDACISISGPMLYEAIVIPDGETFAKNFSRNISILNFVRQEYHRCKPILAIGAASLLLEKSNIPPTLPSGLADPSIIIGTGAQLKKALAELNAMLPKFNLPFLGTAHR